MIRIRTATAATARLTRRVWSSVAGGRGPVVLRRGRGALWVRVRGSPASSSNDKNALLAGRLKTGLLRRRRGPAGVQVSHHPECPGRVVTGVRRTRAGEDRFATASRLAPRRLLGRWRPRPGARPLRAARAPRGRGVRDGLAGPRRATPPGGRGQADRPGAPGGSGGPPAGGAGGARRRPPEPPGDRRALRGGRRLQRLLPRLRAGPGRQPRRALRRRGTG